MKVLICIPTYNEAENIAGIVEAIFTLDVGFDILVIDDGSPDGTAEMVRELMNSHDRLQLLEREEKGGLASAYVAGFRYSVQHGYDVVGEMDADFSHPPELLPELFEPLRRGEADVACASRYVHGGADNRGEASAVFASLAITKLARWFIDRQVLDYTTGYVMAPRALVLELGLRGDYGEYCIELLGSAALRGYRVLEVPYVSISRVEGVSKTATNVFGFVRRGWRYLLTIGRLWLSRRRVAARGDSPGTTTRDLVERPSAAPDPSSGRSEEQAKT